MPGVDQLPPVRRAVGCMTNVGPVEKEKGDGAGGMNEGQEFIKAKIHVNIQKLYIQIKYRLLQNENEIKMLICFVCSIENRVCCYGRSTGNAKMLAKNRKNKMLVKCFYKNY